MIYLKYLNNLKIKTLTGDQRVMVWESFGNKRVIHIQRMRPEARHAVKIWSLGFVDVIPSETVHGDQQDLSGILFGASIRHQVCHTHSNKTQQ